MFELGARAQQWDCLNQPGSLWEVPWPSADGTRLIRNHSYYYLEVENSSSSNGARVQQWEWLNQPGARWRL
ncbi:RICIN domain-containing protein [Streptomyces kaniharaensis]|uniref:RICIN domain-containing protein n=1 Tax=Streptomyces kaniharaensis TaxID=212423 RepID=UPI0012963183|nr:RICIN domain-containing protein [Streptomyces kaniharaensis]